MPTCDKYLHLLPGNVFLVEHFWPEHPKVFVMGFKKPDFEFPNDKWEFVSLGEDKGKDNWSNDIIELFKIIGDEIGEYFQKNKKTEWVVNTTGRWDLIIGFLVKNVNEFDDELTKVFDKFSNY